MELISDICNVVLAASGVVTAVSAVVAVIHFKKHWRDDEPVATLRFKQESFETLRDGKKCLVFYITVANVGKVPFHVGKVRVSDDSLAEILDCSDVLDLDVILDQGTTVTKIAVLRTKDDEVAFPQEVPLALFDKIEKKLCLNAVKPKGACAACET